VLVAGHQGDARRQAPPALVPATMMSAGSMPSVGVVGDPLEAEA
jgi:hypothetical protein